VDAADAARGALHAAEGRARRRAARLLSQLRRAQHGPARGDAVTESVPDVTDRVLRRAGFAPVYPANMERLCCGQPFESKGLLAVADDKAAELEAALRAAADGGRLRSSSTPAPAPTG